VHGVIAVGPDLGQIKRIEPVGLGLFKRHNLHLESPTGIILPFNSLKQITAVVVGIPAGDPVGLLLSEILDALVGLEVVFYPETLSFGIDPHVGMACVAVHVPIAFGDSAIAHQNSDLMGRFRRHGPEVPLHVVVAQAAVCTALLRMDEVLELHGITDEEHRRVIPYHIVVALGGVELERKASHVPPSVGTAALTGHRREPGQYVGLRARLEHGRFCVGTDVLDHLEMSEGPRALRMGLAVRNHLPVEVRHLLNQVVVL